jgi:hypothetical protein
MLDIPFLFSFYYPGPWTGRNTEFDFGTFALFAFSLGAFIFFVLWQTYSEREHSGQMSAVKRGSQKKIRHQIHWERSRHAELEYRRAFGGSAREA